MKKDKKTSGAKITRPPQFGKHSLLIGALVAAGMLSPMAMPPAMAAPLPVPVGLPCGGCNTVAGMPTSFVQAGSITTNLDPLTGLPVGGGTNLTVNQSSQTAILNWQSFNIDKGYRVNFVQPNSTSSALNRIWDANPTTIAGSLTANGQIYLINQNGIIFANGAQVNTGTLVASSLNISDQLFQAGYLTNVSGTPAFSGNSGFVRVDTGAVLNGSRIMMFAPVVENNGSISTPDGQTVLAAGNAVYLEASQDPNLRGVLVEVDVNNPGQVDTNLAGQVQNNASGTVTNGALGNILSQRGNITLVGYAVNQQGRLSATTAVNSNGSIKLLARYHVVPTINQLLTDQIGTPGTTAYDIRATQTGVVTLASNSTITIAPELADPATVTSGQGFNPSIVEVMGNTINMQSGSSIVAPGGNVTLAAISSYSAATSTAPATGLDPTAGTLPSDNTYAYQVIDKSNTLSSFLNPNYKPVPNPLGDTARVFLDKGSSIDVSGSTANVSVARNILTVQLRGSQLADAPLQKNGFLWGKNVYIDIRQGSTLANYSGEESQIARGVAELTSAGGNVKLISTGDVVAKAGSTINISGGQVNYAGANIKTTSLISNGVVYDIATASPNLIYDGISGTATDNHAKWGVTNSYVAMSHGTWDPGYVQGMAAGTLTVLAPHNSVASDVIAKTVAGIYQRQPYVDPATLSVNNYQNTWKMQPLGGTLVIGDSNATKDLLTNSFYNYIADSNISFQAKSVADNFAVTDALPTDLFNTIYLDPNLFSRPNGLHRAELFTNRTITVDAGTSVTLAPGGSLTLQGDTINMLGSIYAPAGTVTFGTASTASSAFGLPGGINIGSAGTPGTISTRGLWVNDSPLLGTTDFTKPLLINGGNIAINSGGDLTVAAGTLFDASGGATINASNKLTGGNGGSITLAGVYDTAANRRTSQYHGQLDNLKVQSYGVAGGKGGTLNIKAADVVIGATGTNALALSPDFFSRGGFTNYNITANGGANGLLVAPDTLLAAKNQSLILNNQDMQRAILQTSGADVYGFTEAGQLPDWQRSPVNISLNQTGGVGALIVGAGAHILVDPKASISLMSDNQMTILGTLEAPAGSINLTLTVPKTASFNAGHSTIWLGSQSKLLSTGTTILTPTSNGLHQGQVLAGGNININSNMFVVAQQGSLMDVSGTSANLDLPQLQSSSPVYRSSHVAGDAGSISIKAREGALLDGSMKASVEAGSTAAAGKFSLTLDGMNAADRILNFSSFPNNPWQMFVQSSGTGSFVTQAGLTPGNDSVAGTADLTAVDGKAFVDVSALQKAGFDQVALKNSNGSIIFADQTTLQTRRSVTLDTPVITAGTGASVSSAYVNLTNSDSSTQINPAPTAGTGTLNVSGQLVDLSGNISVSGVSKVTIKSSGDVRLNGVLNTANNTLQGSLHTQGDILLQADQVYPTTLSQYTLSSEDSTGAPSGTITIQQPVLHATSPVLSAGGQVTLNAATIEQDGVLKAPMGTITLNGTQNITLAAHSLTSVSSEGQIVPFGSIQGGTSWVYDLAGNLVTATKSTGDLVTVTTPPQKQINLAGVNVAIKPGAVVDLSGGGDLYANEFFAGQGGSINVLDPAKAPANTYAILPGISTYAPYDPQLSGQYAAATSKTTLNVGSMVYLAGGNGISAGYYALLPASYALLPGAYRVTLTPGYQDKLPGQGATKLLDGTQIMAGKFAVAGTGIQDARWSGFSVTPGSVTRTQSEFHDSYASAFFAAQAITSGIVTPRLPMDAGQLVVTANGNGATLALDGTFNANSGTGGRGAQVDLNVTGGSFDIVNNIGTANGFVQLDANALSKLGVESLLIGGVRSQTADGTTIAVGADQVQVDNSGSVLSGPEIILAANNAVTVKAGSNIQGKGTFTGHANNITIGSTGGASGDGALLRVSSGQQVTVARNNFSATATPTLTVENGATIGAQDSVLLDSSYATNIGGNALLSGKAFSVSALNIDVGNSPAPLPSSLALTGSLPGQLAGFSDLTLHSYNDINFYGAAAIGGLDANQRHRINNLVLNARSINGLNNAGLGNVVDAATITLMNNNGNTVTPAVYGAGNLNVNADRIVLADGNMAVQGFDAVTFNALNEISGQGTGTTTITSGDANAHALALNAGQITGMSNSNKTISAAGYDINIQTNTGTNFASSEALGAKLAISGKSINDAGVINIPTGTISLNATGAGAADGVTLANGSKITASGVAKIISGQTAYASAGSVALTAANGSITQASGSQIDVSANAGGGDAGKIQMRAANGSVTVAGELKGKASASGNGGSFVLDAKQIVLDSITQAAYTNSLTALNDTLTAGGFTYLRDMRVRTGDLVMAADAGTSRAQAQTFSLAADTGKIDVFGTVDASGTSGGNIVLAANGDVTVEDGAQLIAYATAADAGKGGKVTLETTVGQIKLVTPTNVASNQIDVHGIDALGNATGGSVLLRAPQINGNTDVAVNNVAGTSLKVSSGANVTVEAFRTYNGAAATTISVTGSYLNDANAFMANVVAVKNRLGMGLTDPNMHLTPGVQIDSAGDLTLGSDWDLSAWRFNNGTGVLTETGTLTLRAANNLILNASLSDGFISATSYALKAGPSWSYRLVGGADSSAANLMAVGNAGDVSLAAGTETVKSNITTAVMKQVRTGTGFIDIAAGGNVNLGNRDSVIYTAGQAATTVPAATMAGLYNGQAKVFPVGGGDINIMANNDINGAQANQLVSEWQWREGKAAVNGAYKAPAWWTNFSAFRQNIGALGGGNVTLNAGGNINNLSAVVPTSGYVDATGVTHVLGGGNLVVSAGGDINSGIFYVGNGQGMIRAGGALGATPGTSLNTILLLGQGGFDVRTAGDLNLQTVLNPTMLGISASQKPNNSQISYFYTYDGSGNISLTSLSGNVNVDNSLSVGNYFIASPLYAPQQTTVYPASFQATALGGGITNSANSGFQLFPSSTGNLQLLAATNIDLGGGIGMSDQSPSSLLAQFSAGGVGYAPRFDVVSHGTVTSIDPVSQLPILIPVHANDTVPVSIVAGDNIFTDSNNTISILQLPKQATIRAGLDIINVSANVQNQQATDTTSLTAGRDISFIPKVGMLTQPGLTVTGPGQVVLQAGRNVDLGSSSGVVTLANLNNVLLPDLGADITVLAGVGQGTTATQAFIDKYINPASSSTYGADLISYVGNYGAPQNQTADQAFAYFSTLSKPLQDAFVRQAFFSELRSTGRNAVNTGNYQPGYDAIATLFAGGGYSGDLTLYSSQIKTERGGNINIFTPGGGVNAGLANANSGKKPSELGIVTIKGGDVNAFVNNDFTVNQSRVFTIQGGNIMMWSSYGNIDAGKGSKTASSTPAPLLVVDPKTGAFAVDATASIVGSGIRVLLGNKDVVPGTVDLFAPAGTINAGDAGIGSAGNIFLGAQHVVGADNINFGGVAAGVPVAAPAPVSVGLGNLTDASKAANEATQSIASMGDMSNMNDFKPTFLSVEVIGLGDKNCADDDQSPACRKGRPSGDNDL